MPFVRAFSEGFPPESATYRRGANQDRLRDCSLPSHANGHKNGHISYLAGCLQSALNPPDKWPPSADCLTLPVCGSVITFSNPLGLTRERATARFFFSASPATLPPGGSARDRFSVALSATGRVRPVTFRRQDGRRRRRVCVSHVTTECARASDSFKFVVRAALIVSVARDRPTAIPRCSSRVCRIWFSDGRLSGRSFGDAVSK